MTERARSACRPRSGQVQGLPEAADVAEALAAGLVDVLPQLETIRLPVADGGDGTVAAALSVGFDKITVDQSESLAPQRGPAYPQSRLPAAFS